MDDQNREQPTPPPDPSISNPQTTQSPTNPEPEKDKGINLLNPKFLVGAIILILIVGLPVTILLLSQRQTTNTVASKPAPTVMPSLFLTVDSPTDGTMVSTSVLMIKGKTLPKTTIVFFTENDQNSVEADVNGNFEGTINLASGLNTLTITAFGENGEEKSMTFDIVYDEVNQTSL